MQFQQVVPHHGICFKLYSMLGVAYIRLGNSIKSRDMLMKEGEPSYTELSELSRTDIDNVEQNKVSIDDLFSYELAKTILAEMSGKYGFECYGLDVLVEEATSDLYLVDFNDLPGYLGFPFHAELASSIVNKAIKH